MAIRVGPPLYGRRYCGNKNTKEVHDLQNEHTNCHIDEIIISGNANTFNPDTLEKAYRDGYNDCVYCIGRKKSKKIYL